MLPSEREKIGCGLKGRATCKLNPHGAIYRHPCSASPDSMRIPGSSWHRVGSRALPAHWEPMVQLVGPGLAKPESEQRMLLPHPQILIILLPQGFPTSSTQPGPCHGRDGEWVFVYCWHPQRAVITTGASMGLGDVFLPGCSGGRRGGREMKVPE